MNRRRTTVELDEEVICADCNGSGEGMHDGTRCRACADSGVDARHDSYDDEPSDEDMERCRK